MDTLAGARPKSLSRQPGREAAKTAAVLRNPSTKNLEWYHGTRASSAQLAGGFRISGDDPDPAWPPHWSTGLGVHFAAHHSMANRFADPSIGVGGRGMAADPDHSQTPSVVHARLHVQNPKVYDNEDRMADDVFEHEHGERKNYISNYLKADDERVPYAAGTYFSYDHHPDEAPSRGEYEHFDDWEDHAEGGEERPAPVYRREQWLNLHPDAAGIARRHRERLQSQGYDGIVYGNSSADERVRSRKPESNMAAIAFHPSQIEITKHHVHGDEHKTAAARWSPSSGVFGPTTGHDPILFDGDELRPEVRRDVMERLDRALRVDTGLVGSDWQDWTKVYLAGGSASEWAGARPNDTAEDLDILIGVNYFEARRGSGAFADMDTGQIDTAFNSALRAAFNDPDWHPAFGGTWQLTGYVNPDAYDITKIKPYAAYNITDMTWAVHPPHLPEHTLADFDPAILSVARAMATEARAILRLPEPARTHEARALWERLHSDRRRAFSDEGEGWQDPGNLIEKYLAYAPGKLLERIKELALAKTAARGDLSDRQFGRLESRLLGKGGTRVVNPGFEPDFDKIMKRGQDWDGADATKQPMRSRDCHANAARLCESQGHQIATGYALSDDGLWRQHSWGIHARTGKPIETTTPREKYHGVVLTADEAAEFGRANPSHTAAAERTAAVEPYDGDGEPRPWHRRWPGESDEDVTARRGQYIQQVSDRHGVSPAAAHKVISQVAGDLGEDLAFTDGRKYGFANNPGHHEIFSEEQIKHLMTPEAWHGVPVTHVPAEGLHASQNWLRPRTLAHNLFHPGKKLGQVDDEEGHPDFDPDDIPREEDDYDDIAEGSRPRPDLGQHTRFMRRDNGTMMVVDGHHRAAIDMALGKRTTPGTVIDESRLRAMMKPPAVHLRGEEMSAPELHAHMLQHHDRTRSELPEPRDANHLDLVDEHDHSHEFEDPGHEHEVPASAHEPGRIPAAVIDKYAAAGPWLHGTHRKLRRGDLIEPGHPANDDLGSGGDEGSRPHVYAANTAGMADYFAGEAAGKHPGTTPRIYEVQPTGPMEADPELEEGGIEPEAYRSAHPLRVLREYTPPKTAARDPDSIYIPPPLPEEALERAQTHPHQVAASYAQYHARMNHPRVTMRFPRSHEGGDELVGSILRHTGYEGDTEGSFVARHPRPENKTSNPSWLDGKPGVALHPESWDYGTVAHEAAHHALMYHHAIGPNEHQPDEQIHGPEWSGYYANGLNYISPGAGDDFLRHKQHYLEQIQAHHGMAKEASSDGDRWVTCEQGCEHWGEHGAAGLLIRHRGDDGLYRYLLQKRSDDGDKIDNPGVWSIPSGAIGEHETPEEGARREYREEHGPLPQGVTHHHTVKSTDHGDWAFHTVVMDSPERFEPRGGGKTSFEQQGAAWHTAAEVRGMKNRGELHPAFAESWDKVRQSRPATAVAETYFHATAPDRRGSIREHGLQTSYSADEDMHGDGAEKRLYVSRGVQPDDRWAGQDVWSVDMHGLPMEQDVEPGDFSTWKDIGPERLKLYRTAQATQTQATADYRHADSQQRRCGNCVMFREGVKHDWCTKVKGSIEESGVCRFFYARGETHRRHLSEQKTAVTGYDVAPRTGMIYLDVPPELIHQVPGGVDDHHITLVYLGKGLSDEQFERACQRAAETAARHRPLEGELSGTETFPPSESSKGKTPAFVPAHVPGLSAIRQELEDLSASEHKDFRPHVTLAYLEDGDPVPPPHPAVPVKFTHLHVKRGDDVQSFPLGEPLAKEADYRQPPTEETWEARRQRVSKWLDKQGEIFHLPSKWGPHTSNQVAHALISEHDGPERDEHWEHLPDQEVSLRQPVHTHQGFVYTDTVKHYLNADADPDQHYESGEYTPGGDEPKFVKHNGTHYMLDGHHRYAKDRLMGHESMYGKVFDTANPEHKQANCYECHEDEAANDYDHDSADCPTCKQHGWHV